MSHSVRGNWPTEVITCVLNWLAERLARWCSARPQPSAKSNGGASLSRQNTVVRPMIVATTRIRNRLRKKSSRSWVTYTAPTPARGSLPVVIRTSSTWLPSRKPMTAVSALKTTRPGADSPQSYATLPWPPPRSISPRPPRMLPTGCRKRTVAGSQIASSKCEGPMGSPSTSGEADALEAVLSRCSEGDVKTPFCATRSFFMRVLAPILRDMKTSAAEGP